MNYRKTRKLLEITSHDNFLITDGAHVYGFWDISKDYNTASESAFIVKITGNYTFEILHVNDLLLRSEHNNIIIDKAKISKQSIFDTVNRLFKISDISILSKYYEIISTCISSGHGTIIVFTSCAAEESKRLEHDSIKITPFFPSKDCINLITKIDGAVLFDEKCNCHSIGTILDGDSIKEANSSRGSRYNSALRYVNKIEKSTQFWWLLFLMMEW